MKIKFKFTSQLSLIANKNEDFIEVDEGCNVKSAFNKLLTSYPDDFKKLVLDGDHNLLPAILLIKNDDQISFQDQEPLLDGDEIMLFSPMSGG